MGKGLVIIDVQNDFSNPAGSLYVPGGEDVIDPINKLIDSYRQQGLPIVVTRDWHQRDSRIHFVKDEENPEGEGVWPPHCVQRTWGGQFDDNLDIADVVIATKGTDPEADSYSGFDGTMDNGSSLEEWLRDSGVTHMYVAGLATDYCVKETALSARVLGFNVVVLTDAIRAVNLNPDDNDKALTAMAAAGVAFEQSA